MLSKNKKTISLVIPCYNESIALPHFFEALSDVSLPKNYGFELIFVNDGSTDTTRNVLQRFQRSIRKSSQCNSFKIINFSRNFGKEAALSAGLEHATGHASIPVDCDLQDPLDLIPSMIEEWEKGFDVVLAKRRNRRKDSFLKRMTADFFYKFFNSISETKIPYNIGDFRLLDKRVVDVIKMLPERRRFMKGLFAWVGFRSTTLEFEREKRVVGKTNFSLWKLWNFALEGITGFTDVPLRIWFYIGCLMFLFSLFIVFYGLLAKIFGFLPFLGYSSILVSVAFLGGLNLIGIGIVGEYVGRIYNEVKNRPLYIIESIDSKTK